MRFCLSSSMIGVPQVSHTHSSSGPLGFWSLNGMRFSVLAPATFRSPWLKNTTCVVGWPVTRLQTEQWQVWLSIGSLSEPVAWWAQPPEYFCAMELSLCNRFVDTRAGPKIYRVATQNPPVPPPETGK